ncbi:MAG: HAD family hydrolase [Leptospira sp.]|nr:HAD family hydrolase [Leptospira sp.]
MLILDIDNTIIPSVYAYEFALEHLKNDWSRKYGARKKDFRIIYDKARAITKSKLSGHTSNRLRILYFKKMWEIQNGEISQLGMKQILDMEDRYFRYFIYALKYFKEVHKKEYKEVFTLLRKIQSRDKLVLLSNENLRTQLLKLSSVLPKDIHFQLLVSEELGKEKPAKELFQEAMEVGSIQSYKPSFMIGDSWEDDMVGGSQVGLQLIHQTDIFGNRSKLDISHPDSSNIQAWKTENLITSLEIVVNKKNF